MRLKDCIRRWLGLKAHRVAKIIEQDDQLVAEIKALSSRWPRCGNCGGGFVALKAVCNGGYGET